jgi:hypothetical protein
MTNDQSEAKGKQIAKRKPSGIKMVESNPDEMNFIQNFLSDAPQIQKSPSKN